MVRSDRGMEYAFFIAGVQLKASSMNILLSIRMHHSKMAVLSSLIALLHREQEL
jgi:hypothetical protein